MMVASTNRALAQQQATLGQVRVDALEQLRRQGVLLEQPPKLQQCGRVGHRLNRQVDADELSHGLAVVDRVFHRFVGQAKPLLQKVHAQHARHANRLATDPTTRGVLRLDQRLKT